MSEPVELMFTPNRKIQWNSSTLKAMMAIPLAPMTCLYCAERNYPTPKTLKLTLSDSHLNYCFSVDPFQESIKCDWDFAGNYFLKQYGFCDWRYSKAFSSGYGSSIKKQQCECSGDTLWTLTEGVLNIRVVVSEPEEDLQIWVGISTGVHYSFAGIGPCLAGKCAETLNPIVNTVTDYPATCDEEKPIYEYPGEINIIEWSY